MIWTREQRTRVRWKITRNGRGCSHQGNISLSHGRQTGWVELLCIYVYSLCSKPTIFFFTHKHTSISPPAALGDAVLYSVPHRVAQWIGNWMVTSHWFKSKYRPKHVCHVCITQIAPIVYTNRVKTDMNKVDLLLHHHPAALTSYQSTKCGLFPEKCLQETV